MNVEDLPNAERPWWHKYANCRGMHYTEPNLFFPDRGSQGAMVAIMARSRAVCATCPVQEPCLAAGMRQKHGTWAGLSERQRRALRPDRRQGEPHGDD